jgi:UDP-N-acetylmuramate dehydrogenase
MQVLENFSLKTLNTFGVEASADCFVHIETEEQLQELFSNDRYKDLPRLVLGGGSNMLFTKNFKGLVVHLNIQGLSAEIHGNDVFVSSGAGVVWNDLVN